MADGDLRFALQMAAAGWGDTCTVCGYKADPTLLRDEWVVLWKHTHRRFPCRGEVPEALGEKP